MVDFTKMAWEKTEKWEHEFMSSILLKVNPLLICEDE